MQTKENYLGLYKEYLNSKYPDSWVIISPPRCSSTALARLFWQHPSIRYYAHEPFETTYYNNAGIEDAIQHLDESIDLKKLYEQQKPTDSRGLVVKEMPYQVNSNFEFLISLTKHPVIFLIRDPRLSIYSRIQKKLEVGSNPIFPLVESGWELLLKQIVFCRNRGVEFTIVKSNDFRNHPNHFAYELMKRVGLSFSPELLRWRSANQIQLDNLNGVHSHLYMKVLSSSQILPATESLPDLSQFPKEGGIRDHVLDAMNIFFEILRMEEVLTI